MFLLVSEMTPFLALPRKQVPRAQTIFVAQAGRKFRLFSLTLQRYKNFKSFPNLFAKKTREKARSRNGFTNLLHATVLQLKNIVSSSLKITLYLCININTF